METNTPLLEHTVRLIFLIISIGFAVTLGHFRPEWKSRKTLLSWVWTMAAIDIIIMDGNFARTLSAQMFIGGALMLNVINFIGDRIETIKFKDFSASLTQEEENNRKHSIKKKKKEPEDKGQWPDGERPEPTPAPPRKK